MLRVLVASLGLVLIGSGAGAETFTCTNIAYNSTGMTVDLSADVTSNGIVKLNNDGTKTSKDGPVTYPYSIRSNGSAQIEAEHDGESGCQMTVTWTIGSDQLNMITNNKSGNHTVNCDGAGSTDGFMDKYQCSCNKSSSGSDAKITAVCASNGGS